MNNSAILNRIKETEIFRDVGEEVLGSAVNTALKRSYKSGDKIECENACFFILKGSVYAYSSDEKRQMLLRKIEVGELFGVAGVFGAHPISQTVAHGETEILVFTRDIITFLLDGDSVFRTNYIMFLSNRIEYLNRKITLLSAGSATRRTALYLLSQGDRVKIVGSALSDMLNLGRASLYRSLSELRAVGAIEYDDRFITVLNRQKLSDF